jgi:hypothetical protein
VWDAEVVPMLEGAPALMAVTVLKNCSVGTWQASATRS